jgi:hypothetical protein
MPRGFLKGQLHAHSSRSADSETPPAEVHRWYETHGYDFVVFTDHNAITDTNDTSLLTIPGAELTWNLRNCEPPTETAGLCPLHMNVLFATAGTGPVTFDEAAMMATRKRGEIYREELKLAEELGGIAMLNHPNMHYGADDGILADLAQRGLLLVEVGNQSWDAQNAGDAKHASTEAIWDGALGRGARVFATITDDAHFYGDVAAAHARGERPFPPGLGFVAVRANKSVASIREAVVRGDFYASTGVLFDVYELGPSKIVLATRDAEPVLFEAIGKGGVVLESVRGARLDLMLGRARGEEKDGARERPYVRVRATRADGAVAFTQPVFADINKSSP